MAKFERRDWLTVAALVVAGIALRVPFRAKFVYLWDGVEFIEAMRHFSVVLSQPHAPGYPLYVALGRLVSSVVGDPHASLVWMSVVAGSLTAALLYSLGATMFGRRYGITAGLLGLTSPPLWFYSEVVLTYAVDSALVCVVVLICWRAIQRSGSWVAAVLIGTAWAVASGVRPQNLPMLLPVVAYSLWRLSQPRCVNILAGAGAAGVVMAGWAVPLVLSSGGWEMYREVLHRVMAYQSRKAFAGGGWGALGVNVLFVLGYCWSGLGLSVAPLISQLVHRRLSEGTDRGALTLLGWWIGPMVLMGTCLGYTEVAGHVTSYLPCILLFSALAIGQMSRHCWAVLGVTCLWNVTVFVAAPRWLDLVAMPMARTAQEIRQHDRQIEDLVAIIRRDYDPAETIIGHATGHLFFGLRLFQYYLPEFDQVQFRPDQAMLLPADRPLLAAHGGEMKFVAVGDLAGKSKILLVVPVGQTLDVFGVYVDLTKAEAIPGAAGRLFLLPASAVHNEARDIGKLQP
jgi:MFS family permease